MIFGSILLLRDFHEPSNAVTTGKPRAIVSHQGYLHIVQKSWEIERSL